MISGQSEQTSAPSDHEEKQGGNGNGEWVTCSAAAHTLGVSKRAVRKWAECGRCIAKKNLDGIWEVRLDSLPRAGRNELPGPRPSPRNVPGISELVRSLMEIQKKTLDLSNRNGWLESELARAREIETRLLPAARSEADQARADLHEERQARTDDLARIRRRDRRMVVELVTLAVVAIGAVLI